MPPLSSPSRRRLEDAGAAEEGQINGKGVDGDILACKAVASLTKDYLDLILSYKLTRYVMTMVD